MTQMILMLRMLQEQVKGLKGAYTIEFDDGKVTVFMTEKTALPQGTVFYQQASNGWWYKKVRVEGIEFYTMLTEKEYTQEVA